MTWILLIVTVGLGVYFAFESKVRRRRVAIVIFWLALICVIPIWATSASWRQVPALVVLCTLSLLPVMLLASYSMPPERRWLLAILVPLVSIATFSIAAILLVAYGAVVP